jgi:hypothetical protein
MYVEQRFLSRAIYSRPLMLRFYHLLSVPGPGPTPLRGTVKQAPSLKLKVS